VLIDQNNERGTVMPFDDEPFSLEFQDDQEIWVKHRISGHIVCFPISDGGEWIDDLHRINLDASSAYDGSVHRPAGQRAVSAKVEGFLGQSKRARHATSDRVGAISTSIPSNRRACAPVLSNLFWFAGLIAALLNVRFVTY
jgi:hypothetical protein